MSQAKRQRGREDCGQAIRSIPRSDSDRLLCSTVPLICDDREERKAASFKKSEEEPSCQESGIAVACSHGCLCDTPAEYHCWHQDSMRNLHDEDRREGLPCELGNWRDASNERVLVAFEMGILLETEDAAIPQHGLVQDLKDHLSVND